MKQTQNMKVTGPGAGLRPAHYQELLSRKSQSIKWFEVITENFLSTKGRPRWILEKIGEDYPLAFHGVSLSIGSPDPLDQEYLRLFKNLIKDFSPFLVSDHFCWTGLRSHNTHNLLPLSLNRKNLEYLIHRINAVQDFLGQQMLFENASAYMELTDDDIPEWEFIGEICQRSGCGLLLDINNLYVTATNFGREPSAELRKVPGFAVKQIHLAGYTDMGQYLFDTHSKAVQAPVWNLFDQFLSGGFCVPTMIEWDDEIPPLKRLEAEVDEIRKHQDQVQGLNSKAINEMVHGL